MKVRALGAILCGMLVAAVVADDMAIKNQEKKTFKARTVKAAELEYLLFLPAGYKEDKEKPWPLMLFLHGAGERGKEIAKSRATGGREVVTDRSR